MPHFPTLSTAYLPPVEYFAFLTADVVCIEACEHYVKQSYRNRACIMTGNGPYALIIPIEKAITQTPVRDIKIDYTMPWQKNHWRTILSAYGNSPFFLYYRDALQPFYEKRITRLFDFNLQLLHTLLALFPLSPTIIVTDNYESMGSGDLRCTINPKAATSPHYPYRISRPYRQTFDDRFGFVPNLSALDLLANMGNESINYIQNFCTFASLETNRLSL